MQSVAEASFDAWTKYYRPDENTPNATVSYYTKGALVAYYAERGVLIGIDATGPVDNVTERALDALRHHGA